MSAILKTYKFYIAETGEILQKLSLKEDTSDEELNKIRQTLALNKGIEANSIVYTEEN